jgi:hypothetical protein
MKTKILILALALVLFLAAGGAALANGTLELPRWLISGGATDATSGDISLHASLGQPVVGIVSGEDVSVGQGFWFGGSGFYIYLPLVMR